jgi:outer membrane protein OmpA-like peptidoglycan-associated protein
MAEDWFADVRRYDGNADESVVRKITNYLGIALRNRDSSLVSFSEPQELARVRENYLRKKLGLTQSDAELDAGLDWVKGVMSADRTKNRVTVYYLLAHYFGKLDLFGGTAGTSAGSLGGGSAAASAAAAAGLGVAGAAASKTTASSASVTPLRSDATSSSGTEPSTTEDIPVYPAPTTSRTAAGGSTLGQTANPSRPASAAGVEDDERGGSGWPKWLTWLLIGLAVIALFLILRSCMAEKTSTTTNVATTAPATTAETATGVSANAATSAAQGTASTAIPAGAGVVSGERDSKPMLTVYFDTGKSAVTKDMAAAATTLKTYLDAHPGSKLAVSGYNDPSGNAALNAELSKKRAQAVAAALKSAGVPETSVVLVKPSDTTTTTVSPEQARRVEITVQQ